ncbi:c-type lectin domain-containing protein [Caerostris darwini]|uniref:C-type lectin domain-containing protein n=2 Tax=Caerostris darwini TaxID=1538125 RepID=A0AAV4VEP9_9ARAC|nr:c-type lectin domain-containing protein [Caerostris darwini]
MLCFTAEGSMNCFKGHPPPQQILEKKGISVTECLEHCRGLGFPLAGSIPDKCYCLQPDNLNNLEVAARLECNGNCQNQHCGNKDFITIYNLSKKNRQTNKEMLHNYGLFT